MYILTRTASWRLQAWVAMRLNHSKNEMASICGYGTLCLTICRGNIMPAR